ncbi:MAG: hypothetical protein V1663_02480 [archaeon]
MEKSQYHNIREYMAKSRKTHNNIVNSIENIREKQGEEAYFHIEEGRATLPFFYNESLKMIRGLEKLHEVDISLEEELPKYKSHNFAGVLKN